MNGNKPEKKLKVGGVSAAIWKRENKTKDNRRFKTWAVSLDRTYKDKNGNWEHTNTFGVSDIPKVQLVVQRALEYVLDAPQEDDAEEEGVPVEDVR